MHPALHHQFNFILLCNARYSATMNHEEGPMIAPESPDPEATETEGATAPEENNDAAEGITRDTRLAGGLD